jgi:hypothetical protein
MATHPVVIDRDKLRAAVRKLGHEYVFDILDDATDLLPPAKLDQIARKYLDLKRLCPDSEMKTKANLLANVKAFDKASRAGEYYESFMVNSRNCTAQSTGTIAWIAEYCRLLDRCVAEEKQVSPAEVREAFGVLFELLDNIDECNDGVIFFADEGGSWQVGFEGERVLQPWFKVLSATATPGEYAERITTLLERHYNCGRDKMLAVARKTATQEQRAAPPGATGTRARGRWGYGHERVPVLRVPGDRPAAHGEGDERTAFLFDAGANHAREFRK